MIKATSQSVCSGNNGNARRLAKEVLVKYYQGSHLTDGGEKMKTLKLQRIIRYQLSIWI